MENKYYKRLTLEDVEKAIKEILENQPEPFWFGYFYPSPKMEEEINKEILKSLQEYNTSKSVRHPNAKK